jgi:hypothetical protein
MMFAGTGVGVAQMARNIANGQEVLLERSKGVRLARAAAGQASTIGQLEAENAELRLYMATVISLLIKKNVISHKEFESINKIIDKLDGVEDGRFDGGIKSDGKLDRSMTSQDVAMRELAAAVQKMHT